jgi:hypothetical protein
VEIDPHIGVLGQNGEERKVGAITSFVDHFVEVAERLVAMGGEDEVQVKLLSGSAQSYRRDSMTGGAR